MTISNRHPLAVQVEIKNTREMMLKIIAAQKQEAKSNLNKARQALEDIKQGIIPEAEYKILHAEAELKAIEEHEKMIRENSSVDTQQVKDTK